MTHRIAVIAGDGIGKEVMPEGLRALDRYAVRCGGGHNHRTGLYDGIMIKDNHIEAVGGIKEAVSLAKAGHHLARIEVEVENFRDLEEALEAKADIIMLDNMSIADMTEAVKIVSGRVALEASGNVSLENVREIAETGVDFGRDLAAEVVERGLRGLLCLVCHDGLL